MMYLLTSLLIFCCFPVFSEEFGQLKVSYETTEDGTRLEEVRFWLRDASGKQVFYPQEEHFLLDIKTPSIKVIAEQLLPGMYEIEFLVPNKDGFFQSPEIKPIQIVAGETTEIHVQIRPFPTQESAPTDENAAMSSEETPPKLNGKLIVGIAQKTESIQATLTGEDGAEISLFEIGEVYDDPMTEGCLVMCQSIPEGSYRLRVETLTGEKLMEKTIVIIPGKTLSVSQALQPQYLRPEKILSVSQ